MSTEHKPHSSRTWGEALAFHYKTGDYVTLGMWAQDHVPDLLEQLEALRRANETLKDEAVEQSERFESVLSLAEHLFQMIPQEVWREHGAEWMGQYEGDHHAQQVLEQLRAWRGSFPASEPKDA